MDYEKQLNRILPIPEATVRVTWNDEKIRVEAEKWCKPFCCAVQRCLGRKGAIKTEEEKKRCDMAPAQLERCVNDISDHLKGIIEKKKASAK
ncbi:unnamed protein product [Blepharisma stoltei]|uniref:Uncharacterized protein n=1 Tax=Blepharisma stoltei TaxID=1481888 RepID=A0AAU9KDK8_9CILI|nr:unnamed protein product [Blepharisma stoltei]